MIALRHPVVVCAVGAHTPVGLSAPAASAAMRAGVNAFRETSYRTKHGELVVGAAVPGVTAAHLGIPYLAALAAPALAECLEALPAPDDVRVRVYFGTQKVDTQRASERTVGYLKTALVGELVRLGVPDRLRSFDLEIVPEGDMSFVHALMRASILLAEGRLDYAVVGGADTYLTGARLRSLEKQKRLKTPRNSDGLIPGEGSCFLAVAGSPRSAAGKAVILSAVVDTEQSIQQGSNRGDAWTRCIRTAVSDAHISYRDIGFRPTNLTGERLQSLEEGLAIMRCFLEPMSLPRTWNLAASVGAIGASSGALMATWTVAAFERGYAPRDTALCEVFADDGQRAAYVMRSVASSRHSES